MSSGKLICAFWVLTIFQSFAQDKPAEPQKSGPIPFAEILADIAPFQRYASAYSSLQFESNVSLAFGQDADGQTMEGHTLLKRNEGGNILFLREPMHAAPTLEFRFVKGKAYLRQNKEVNFSKVRYQKEFDRWFNSSFSEIFALYVQAGFSEIAQGTIKDTKLCYQKKEGSICLDPATGLPLQGSLNVLRKDKSSPRLEFKVEPFGPGVVTIDDPEALPR